MVVLIYIFLHSSKYSINTVNKPSHKFQFYFQHVAFLWPFDTHLFQHWAFWMARKKKNKNPKPDIHATNLLRQNKEIRHIKYDEI